MLANKMLVHNTNKSSWDVTLKEIREERKVSYD